MKRWANSKAKKKLVKKKKKQKQMECRNRGKAENRGKAGNRGKADKKRGLTGSPHPQAQRIPNGSPNN